MRHVRFRPGKIVEASPLLRPRPVVSTRWSEYLGPRGEAVFLHLAARSLVVHWAREADPLETMGLLVGRPCADAFGSYTLVVSAVLAPGANSGRAHVVADHAAVLAARGALRDAYPIAEVAGWWHTHPGYTAHFSGTDFATQATFDARHLVGLVIDPRRDGADAIGIYLGPGATRLEPTPPPASIFGRAPVAGGVVGEPPWRLPWTRKGSY